MVSLDKKAIANRIKEARKISRVKQKDVSKETGIPQNTLSQWESGDREIPASIIAPIAKLTGYPVEYFLFDDTSLPKEKIHSARRLGEIIDEKDEKIRELEQRGSILTETESKLLRVFRKATPERKVAILTAAVKISGLKDSELGLTDDSE